MRDRVSYTMVFGEQCRGLSGKTGIHRQRSNWRGVSMPTRVDHTYMVSYLLFPLIYLNVLRQITSTPACHALSGTGRCWEQSRAGQRIRWKAKGFAGVRYEPGEKNCCILAV
jgi:hypothetical protein